MENKFTNIGFRFVLSVIIVWFSFLAFSMFARADMAPPYSIYDSPFLGLVVTFIVNIPINLFWFMLFLILIIRKYGNEIADFPESSSKFLLLLFLTSFVVTLLGAIIDLFLLYEVRSAHYFLTNNNLKWAIATLLIFVSIFITSHFILKIKLKYNTMISGAIAILNPVFWYLIIHFEDTELCYSFVILFFLVPIPLIYLLRWHHKTFGNSEKTTSDLKELEEPPSE